MEAQELSRESEWTQVRPGRWERGIDEAEEIYTSLARQYAGSGRTLFAITGHISTTSVVPVDVDMTAWEEHLDEAIRRGWLALRNDQPAIASWTEWSIEGHRFVKVYEELKDIGSSGLECEWLAVTCKTITGFASGQQFCNSDPPAPKLPTLFVVNPCTDGTALDERTVRRDLVIRSHHDIMDGLGTLFLFDRLLTHVVEALEFGEGALPIFGDEWKRLSPSLRAALRLESSVSEEIKAMYDEIVSYNTAMSESADMLLLPCRLGQLSPGKHQRVEVNLSENNTKQLLAACKKRGVSVTHVYHAAAVVALGQLQQRGLLERKARYIKFGLVNLRDKCKEPYCTAEYGAAVYHSGSPRSLVVDVTIPAVSTENGGGGLPTNENTEFNQVLEVVKSFYLQIRDDEYLTQLYPLLLQNIIPKCDWASSEPMPLPAPSKEPSVTMSSLGVIDKVIKHDHGIIKVYDPWVVGEELGNSIGLFLRTFGGQLSLSAAYNDAWHSAQGSLDFIRRCNDIVQRGLHGDT